MWNWSDLLYVYIWQSVNFSIYRKFLTLIFRKLTFSCRACHEGCCFVNAAFCAYKSSVLLCSLCFVMSCRVIMQRSVQSSTASNQNSTLWLNGVRSRRGHFLCSTTNCSTCPVSRRIDLNSSPHWAIRWTMPWWHNQRSSPFSVVQRTNMRQFTKIIPITPDYNSNSLLLATKMDGN